MIDTTELGINCTSTEIMLRILVEEILTALGPKTGFFAKFREKLSRDTLHSMAHISIPVILKGLVFGRAAAEGLLFETPVSYLPQIQALFQ